MARNPYKLYPHDYVLRAIALPFIPRFVMPNHLTVLRLLMTPVVIGLLAFGNLTLGVPLFIAAAFTDALDGSLARVRRQITPWSILFDPIADKLLIGLVALTFALQYYPPILVVAAVVFDLLPMTIWFLRAKQNRALMMANGWGKAKMLLQFASMTILLLAVLLHVPVLVTVGASVLVASTVLAAIAAVTYSL